MYLTYYYISLYALFILYNKLTASTPQIYSVVSYINYLNTYTTFKWQNLILFLNLSGLPPVSFFFLKFNFLLTSFVAINLVLQIFIFVNFLMGMFFYLQVFNIKNNQLSSLLLKSFSIQSIVRPVNTQYNLTFTINILLVFFTLHLFIFTDCYIILHNIIVF